MKKNKKVKTVEPSVIKDVNEDTNQIKKLVIILIGVALVAVLLYFLSSQYLIGDGVKSTDSDDTEVTISYTEVNVGNVFNRPYSEYYVLAYDSDSLQASYYGSLLSTYSSDTSTMYFLDLSKDINKKYVGEESNPDATTPSELSLTEPTLIKIKNGKIVKYLDNIEDIENEIK